LIEVLFIFFGKYGKNVPLGDPDVEWKRSKPDICVYLPKGSGIYNGDNEHFLVFKAPKSDELLALCVMELSTRKTKRFKCKKTF